MQTGKGGVGKTTTSSCLSIQLAKKREKVLIVSTDPAHNLSDAFCQKFGRDPMLVNGFKNLYVMEIDANADMDKIQNEMSTAAAGDDEQSVLQSLMGDLTSSIPGIDEAMSFSEVRPKWKGCSVNSAHTRLIMKLNGRLFVWHCLTPQIPSPSQLMKQVQTMDYDTIVFDTAPTGHTLRLLSFPTIMEKALGKVMDLKDKFGGMLSSMTGLMGGAAKGPNGENPADMMLGKVREGGSGREAGVSTADGIWQGVKVLAESARNP